MKKTTGILLKIIDNIEDYSLEVSLVGILIHRNSTEINVVFLSLKRNDFETLSYQVFLNGSIIIVLDLKIG